MPAILLSADLMTSSQVAGAATRQQVQLITLANPSALAEHESVAGADLVILDLTIGSLDPAAMVATLKSLPDPPRRIIAFGPHVHEARLTAAQAAGCDAVLSRGQFHATMDALLSGMSD